MDKAKEFLAALRSDPKAQELLQGVEKPADEKDVIRNLAEAAKKLGYDVTEEELAGLLSAEEKAIKERTDAEADRVEALADDQLEAATGGSSTSDDPCKSTYLDHENCWFNDGCDNIINTYKRYRCHHATRNPDCGEAYALKPLH